jgi:osmotically-inducible protein OsmY
MKSFYLTKILILSTLLLSSAQMSVADSENDSIILARASNIMSMNSNFSRVGVTVKKGKVILAGTVNNVDDATNLICLLAQINDIEDISSSSLKSLDDKLSLTADTLITTKIKANIVKAPSVRVSTNAGGVSLFGTVASMQKANEIETLASKVEGVKCVASHLSVT